MSEARILLVIAAAVAAGFAATNFTIASHGGGGGDHNHATHSDGGNGTWHMQDDKVRHCVPGPSAGDQGKCGPWM